MEWGRIHVLDIILFILDAVMGEVVSPKDVQALQRAAQQVGYDAELLKATESVNFRQKNRLFEKIKHHFGDAAALAGKTMALWGLSFKPNTDDMREAPSRALIEALWQAGVKVQAFDPVAMKECQHIYGQRDDLVLMGTKEQALRNADGLIIVTEWQQFRVPDFDLIKTELKNPVIFDGRNLFNLDAMKRRGFTYYSIGRNHAS